MSNHATSRQPRPRIAAGLAVATVAALVGTPNAAAQSLLDEHPNRTPSPAHRVGDKKVIHLGWSMPSDEYWREHAADVQGRPFDGVTFHLGEGRFIDQLDDGEPLKRPFAAFTDHPWTEDDVSLGRLGDIDWGQYRHNFVFMLGTGGYGFHWFDDALWDNINRNAALVGRAVDESGARGVLFDPEYYGLGDRHPWKYDDELYPDRSFEQVTAKVRQRGEAYARALVGNNEHFVFLSIWGYGITKTQSQMADDNIVAAEYAMLPAFLDGMLDTAKDLPGFVLVDGNEITYYVDDTRKAAVDYDHVRFATDDVIAPEHHAAWQAKHQVGMAIYPDYFFEHHDVYQWGHPAEYQAKWLEHNLYHHLLLTDEFVWFWDEDVNWWPEPGSTRWPTVAPEATYQAIHDAAHRARDKFNAGGPLGYDMAKPIDSEWEPERAADWVASPKVQLRLDEDVAWLELLGSPDQASVQRIVFYANGAKIGETTQAPHRVTLPDAPRPLAVWARAESSDASFVTSNHVTVGEPR